MTFENYTRRIVQSIYSQSTYIYKEAKKEQKEVIRSITKALNQKQIWVSKFIKFFIKILYGIFDNIIYTV